MKKLLACLLTALLLFSGTPIALAQSVTDAEAAKPNHYTEGEAIVCLKPESLSRDAGSSLLADMDVLMTLDSAPRVENADNIQSYRAAEMTGIIGLVRADGLSTEALIDALSQNDRVLYAEPNYVFNVAGADSPSADITSYKDLTAYQWAYNNQGALGGRAGMDMGIEGWDKTPEASGDSVVVAVLDTGIDYTHPDLAPSIWTRPEGMRLDGGTYGYNSAGTTMAGDPYDETDPMDDMSHGTHCAGIIASGWNGHGTSGASGNAQLMAVKAGNDGGGFSSASILKGYAYIKAACQNGVNVVAVNNSWGGQYSGIALNEAITQVGELGVVSVFASGNEFTNCDENSTTVWGLKSNPYVIAVNALDSQGEMAYFSNYGPRSTDIAAPGVNILSTYPMSMARYCARLSTDEDNLRYNSFEDSGQNGFSFKKLYQNQGMEIVSGTFARDGVASLKLTTGAAEVNGSTLDVAGLESEPVDLSALAEKPAFLSLPAVTPIRDGLSPDNTTLVVSAAVKTVENTFLPLYNATEPDKPLAQSHAGLWSDNAFILPDNTDWADFTLRIEANIFDTSDQQNPSSLSGEIYLDALGIGSALLPYADSSGTSMAAPAVTGEVAILAARYPEDSSAKRAARVIGSAVWAQNLKGTSVSGGYASLKNVSQPAPVLNRALPGSGENELVIDGYFFGDSPGALAIEKSDLPAENILDWSDTQIRVRLPEGFTGGEKTVTVTQKADGGSALSGHQSFELFDSNVFYENSLPLPDPKAQHSFYDMTAQSLTALNGKLYYLGTLDDTHSQVWRYDIQSREWTQLETENSEAFIPSDATCTWNGKLVTTALRSDNNHFCLALYTPETNRWELFEHPALSSLLGASVATSGDTLVVAGGMDFSILSDTLPAASLNALRAQAASGADPEALSQSLSGAIGETNVDQSTLDFDKLFVRDIYTIRPDKNSLEKSGELAGGRAFGKTAYTQGDGLYMASGYQWDKAAGAMTANNTLEHLKDGRSAVILKDILPTTSSAKPEYVSGTLRDGMLLAGSQGKVDGDLYDTWQLGFSSGQGFTPVPKRMGGDLILELTGTAYNGQFYVLGSSPSTQSEMLFRSTAVETIPQTGEQRLPEAPVTPAGPDTPDPAAPNASTGILSGPGALAACAALLAAMLVMVFMVRKRTR